MWAVGLAAVAAFAQVALASLDAATGPFSKDWDLSKKCNGNPGLCPLQLNQVTFVGAHNADAVGLKTGKEGFFEINPGCFVDNHNSGIVPELDAGLRFFDIDLCMTGGITQICHGPAHGLLFDEELGNVAAWFNQPEHRREVAVLGFMNAHAEEKTQKGKEKMMKAVTALVEKHLGHLLYRKPGNKAHYYTPTLEDMITKNQRIVVIFGQIYYFQMYEESKKGNHEYNNKYLWWEQGWASTYGSEYSNWHAGQLEDYLLSFCDNSADPKYFKHHQPMVLADAYLSIGKRMSLAFCNKDLAKRVNPVLLEDKDVKNGPLLEMQQNCWKNGKQLSLVGMDYAEYFSEHLDTTGRALNSRNVAQYNFVAGALKANADLPEAKFQEKLAHWGGVPKSRIVVVKKESTSAATIFSRRLQENRTNLQGRRLTSAVVVFFKVVPSSCSGSAMREISNTKVLAKIKEVAATDTQVEAIKSVCMDPGSIPNADRNVGTSGGFLEGESIQYTCISGFLGHGALLRTCQADGLFGGVQPRCKEWWSKSQFYLPGWAWALIFIGIFILCCGGCIATCKYCRRKKEREYSKVESPKVDPEYSKVESAAAAPTPN